jgi:probable F420-dependent oxidoreductase
MKIDASLMFDPVRNGVMAAELEELGFDGVYSFEGQHDAFMSLAPAAGSTTRMDLMTSVAIAFVRSPMNIAYLANDLQMMSRGRFILGLGTQVKAHVERRFSMPWSKPAARMRETVQAIRAIWDSWESGGKLDFEGEFYTHNLMPPTFSPGRSEYGAPPVYIAGVGPLMTQVAAEVGDGYFVHPFHTPESFAQLSRPALERGLAISGRNRDDLTISAQVVTAVGDDKESLEQALFSARSQLAFYASTPAYRPVLEVHGWEDLQPELQAMSREGKWLEMAALVDDEMLHTFAVSGSVEEVARQLVQRCRDHVDRVSPVIYQPDTELLGCRPRAPEPARCTQCHRWSDHERAA